MKKLSFFHTPCPCWFTPISNKVKSERKIKKKYIKKELVVKNKRN